MLNTNLALANYNLITQYFKYSVHCFNYVDGVARWRNG